MDIFRIDVIDMSLLEGIWLVSSFLFLLRAVSSIVPFVMALVAHHLGNILCKVIMVVTIISPMSVAISFPRVVVVVILVAIVVVAITSMMWTSISTMNMVIISTKLVIPRVTIPFIGSAWFLVCPKI